MRKWGLLAVAAVGLSATALLADDAKKEGAFSDKEFVAKAAVSGKFEVKSGELALRSGQSADVKKFAQHLVTDHTKANQELMTLASRKRWELPTALDGKHQEMMTRLSAARGAEFDKSFMEVQVKEHEKAVALFEQASKQAQDPDLKAWATKTLPKLREHLDMARKGPKGGH